MNFRTSSKKIKFCYLSILILMVSFCASTPRSILAQAIPATHISGNAESQITIDGSLKEKAWGNASVVSLNYERFPNPNGEPPVDTRVYITYDSNNLYVGFKANDPSPKNIRAHLMDRDSSGRLEREDQVGFTIDPFNNGQWGFQFIANPLGVQADGMYSDQENSTNYSWDSIWKSEGSITENGYEVEIRIPFSSINIPAETTQSWRFSAFRVYPRNVRHRIISHPIDLNNQSYMSQFNRIRGFENLSSGLNFEVNPVLTAKRTDEVTGASDSELSHEGISVEPGGNLRWGIRPNLNLSATINPDFSQVEADAQQLRENQRFALSFPEKRPFFLESSEIFDTPFDAVFTRSIIEPEAGIKMTGKSGSHSFGTFITRDQSSRMLFPSNEGSQSEVLNQQSYSEILRYQNQLSDKAVIGVLAEGRQALESNYINYVGGIDGHLRFMESNILQFQYLHSSTNYTDNIAASYGQPKKQFGGDALTLDVNHNSRNWMGTAKYTSITKGFRNDNGFVQRANMRSYRSTAQYILRGSSKKWYSSIQFGPSVEFTTNQSGTLTDQTLGISGIYTGPLQSEIQLGLNRSKKRFDGQLFDALHNGVLFLRFQSFDFLSKLRLYTALRQTIDFTNIRKSKELIIHPGLTFNLSRNLNLELDPNFQRLSHKGTTTFSTYLLGTKLIYHFNKRTFFRSIFQYRYVDRNLEQFNNPDEFDSTTQSLFYQLLFSYKINPQSKLFLGYSSGYNSVNERPPRIQNRTGFLKIGYAWIF